MAINYPTSLDTFTNPTATSLLTSPSHAQQHSDINDAVEALQTKVAIGNTVLGTYTAYTPTWTSLTVGNGTVSSAYCQVNNFVHYFGVFTLGSTSVVTGGPVVSMPITAGTPFSSGLLAAYGTCSFFDTSAGQLYDGIVMSTSGTTGLMRVGNTTGTYLIGNNTSATVPFTWATSDRINWNLYYRAA
jgi:hypothetical protein